MVRPKMILFDYGETLARHAREYDALRAAEAVMAHVTENPMGVTAADYARCHSECFFEARAARHAGFEVHNFAQMRFTLEYLCLKLDLPIEEMETIEYDAGHPTQKEPGMAELLVYLRGEKIRTGVISNIGYSGGGLARRIHSLFPDHDFEFIIASSEYGYRKPSPKLFELALRKAGIEAGDAWYCGDRYEYDVLGAHGAGIFPVHYQSGFQPAQEIVDPVDHLSIARWAELVDCLKALG